MRIALFDHRVTPQNPAGSLDARILERLSQEHDFTVFASELRLDTGLANGVAHVRVTSIRRPALASYLMHFAGCCLAYLRARARGRRFDVVHVTECALPVGDVFYAHFCHRAFLRDVWADIRGPASARRLHAWASHCIRAAVEARLVRRSRVVVVPAEGLRRDMIRMYPGSEEKIVVIRNTVDVSRFTPPDDFDRAPTRERMHTGDGETAFIFIALGHFERKGLPLLLDALARGNGALDDARLWVVGGERDLVESYRARAQGLGVGERVAFAGKVEDVRPFLWSADAFVSPSHYEAFQLGLLEAAGAGLPLLVSRISGSDELLADGDNGFELERTAEGVAAGLARFMALDPSGRERMSSAARASVEPLGPARFDAEWQALYASLEPAAAHGR
jgi:glycosyltransferase involved in cell wall biosynthesis